MKSGRCVCIVLSDSIKSAQHEMVGGREKRHERRTTLRKSFWKSFFGKISFRDFRNLSIWVCENIICCLECTLID